MISPGSQFPMLSLFISVGVIMLTCRSVFADAPHAAWRECCARRAGEAQLSWRRERGRMFSLFSRAQQAGQAGQQQQGRKKKGGRGRQLRNMFSSDCEEEEVEEVCEGCTVARCNMEFVIFW